MGVAAYSYGMKNGGLEMAAVLVGFEIAAIVFATVATLKLHGRCYFAGCVYGVVAAFFIALSFLTLIGFTRMGLGDAQLGRHDASDDRARLEDRIRDLKAQRDWLVVSRSPAQILAEIEIAKADPIYTRKDRTDGCKNDTREDSRVFCDNFRKLGAQLEDAKSKAKLDKDITDAELALSAKGRVVVDDYVSSGLHEYIGIKTETTDKWRPMAIAFGLAIIAWFGPSLAHGVIGVRKAKAATPPAVIETIHPLPRNLEVVLPPFQPPVEIAAPVIEPCLPAVPLPEAFPEPAEPPSFMAPAVPVPEPETPPDHLETPQTAVAKAERILDTPKTRPLTLKETVPVIEATNVKQLRLESDHPSMEQRLSAWAKQVEPGTIALTANGVEGERNCLEEFAAYSARRGWPAPPLRGLGKSLKALGYPEKRDRATGRTYFVFPIQKTEAKPKKVKA